MKKMKFADAVQLTENLWVGGELNQDDPARARRQLDELMAAGVNSIIDCRMGCTDIDWVTDSNPTIDYLSIGVEDAGFVMPDDWFDDGTSYALDQIGQGRSVLAHCQAGINRGPTIAFVVLIAQGWDSIDALDLIRSKRPIARIAYAEQAIDWWLETVGAPDDQVVAQIRRIKMWRVDNNVPRTV
jgi:hypothetical protein